MASACLLAIGCLLIRSLGAAGAFPLAQLAVDQATFHELNASGVSHDDAATSLLLPHMQQLFGDAKYAIEVERGDVVIQAGFPDEQIDGDCHHRIEAEHPRAVGTLDRSSSLRFGVGNISWRGATVFAQAEVDSSLDIKADVCVRVGREIFGHHCSQIARKTVGIDVLSDGRNGIGINMTASNAHVAKVEGVWSLVFDFHASVVGTVLSWNVEKVTANNCKIKIIGIQIASVCGTIERHVRDNAQKMTDRVEEVQAPALLRKLEAKINTAVGSRVVIPLQIPGAPLPDAGTLVI